MRNRPYGFEIYLINVKTMRTIALVLVAFSEKLNFKGLGITVIEKRKLLHNLDKPIETLKICYHSLVIMVYCETKMTPNFLNFMPFKHNKTRINHDCAK